MRIAIIDYGMGNLNSVKKKLIKLKADVVVTSDKNEILTADKIILPGVGHFAKAMENLRSLDLIDTLNDAVLIQKKPILGICLGMQLMANRSEEGDVVGLGWIDAEVIRLKVEDTLKYKIPHTGWNQIKVINENPLMKGIENDTEFYFVHSYHLKMENTFEQINTTEYEGEFTSAFGKNNIYGVQYHPEKSHDVGLRLLKNFIEL